MNHELKKPTISAFFPCYNDAGTIASMVVLVDQTLRDVANDYEIIVIDDGSSDHSREVLQALEKRFDKLRLLFHEKNRGYGGALRSGFSTAKMDLIFYTDGDFQYDVTELKKLLPMMNPEVDIVQGYKMKRHDPLHRIVIGRVYQYAMKALFNLRIKDVDCDFRLIRRSVFSKINLEHNSGIICLEMIKKIQDAGFRFAEVPVNHFFRAYGKSQFFNFKRVFRVGLDIFKLWWKLVIMKT